MILAFDCSSAACSAALLASDGTVIAERHEVIDRGHAERLMPMIAELLSDHIPTGILVGVGPGSFTGLRVALAAAHGMAIGWSIPLTGMDSLALLAAGAPGDGPVGVVMTGGHGEWFVAQYERPTLAVTGMLANLAPAAAAAAVGTALVVGNAAEALVALRGHGEARANLPRASHALRLPPALRSLEPRPIYARAPDAQPRQAA
ncbi:MAG: tRNA (adenosine(37)-N6)-threonylcarbamoyltransferase complex dimerization subunit type 1 TsaB [Pseudomonadota bacterium]|nr:tRNA (adenosine(37)-N6)-threonylcarbamoyltransferase complex dimerization subunit type 1 TsaB [Pseudomonadota bacterium]